MALHVISKSYRHGLNSLLAMYSSETSSRYQFIIYKKENVGLVTLNRPKALNALCDGLIARLVVTVGELDTDESVGAVVITGSQKALDVQNRSPRPLLNVSQHLDENTFRTIGNGRRFFSTRNQSSIEKDEVPIVRKWKFLPSFLHRGFKSTNCHLNYIIDFKEELNLDRSSDDDVFQIPLSFYESQMKVKDEEIKKLVKKCAIMETNLNSANAMTIELKLILGLRAEIEELEIFLWPIGPSKPTLRLDVWTKILSSHDPKFVNSKIVMEFRSRLQEKNVSVDFFIKKCVLKFHQQTSNLGAHKIKFPNRNEITPSIIVNVLETIGLPCHENYVKSLELLLDPLSSTD